MPMHIVNILSWRAILPPMRIKSAGTGFIIWLCLIFCGPGAKGQQVWQLTLKEAIALAEKQSPDGLLASTLYKGSQWRYRYYRADYLPSLNLNTVLPDLNRSYSRITRPDGRDSFVYRRLANSSATLSLNQNIAATGGTVSLLSNVQRIDIFGNAPNTSYVGVPLSVGLNQPLFGYNDLRWRRKIEPLYFKEAARTYAENMEDLHLKVVSLYFDVLATQSRYTLARLDLANSDTLYKLGQGRYRMGTIAENDLLQLELNMLNAGLAVQSIAIETGSAQARFKSYLGLAASDSVSLSIPPSPDSLAISPALAWQQARQYSSSVLARERRMAEAERDIARARGDNGFRGNITGEFGLNGTSDYFPSVYSDPVSQQQFRLSFNMPILNWGKSKGAIEMARAQRDLLEVNIKKELTDYEQDVHLQASQYLLQRRQLSIAKKAEEVGNRRYFISHQRYLIGKIDITDLNIALSDKNNATRAYLETLRQAWAGYYRLRRITLYDFSQQRSLTGE